MHTSIGKWQGIEELALPAKGLAGMFEQPLVNQGDTLRVPWQAYASRVKQDHMRFRLTVCVRQGNLLMAKCLLDNFDEPPRALLETKS